MIWADLPVKAENTGSGETAERIPGNFWPAGRGDGAGAMNKDDVSQFDEIWLAGPLAGSGRSG